MWSTEVATLLYLVRTYCAGNLSRHRKLRRMSESTRHRPAPIETIDKLDGRMLRTEVRLWYLEELWGVSCALSYRMTSALPSSHETAAYPSGT
jgi:hypothetical protein